jgi:hypothetical protein
MTGNRGSGAHPGGNVASAGPLQARLQAEIARVLAVGHLDPTSIVTFSPFGVPLVTTPRGVRFASKGLSLAERFFGMVNRQGPVPAGREWLGPCHLWLGGYSRGGERRIRYPAIAEGVLDGGTQGRVWRCCRLALLLHSGFTDVPEDEGELFITWLRRANRHFRHLEASHDCDNSECVNAEHLRWQDHADQMAAQRYRKLEDAKAAEAAEAAEATRAATVANSITRSATVA